jgi:chitin synthase
MIIDSRLVVTVSAGAFVVLNVFLWIILPRKIKEDSKTFGRIYTIKKYTYLSVLFSLNIGLCIISYIFNEYKVAFFVVLAMKSRDIITATVWIISLLLSFLRCTSRPSIRVENKTIVSVIPVYGETVDQVERTLGSIVDNEMGTNKNLLCVICDGKKIDLEKTMTIVSKETLKYTSWKMISNTIDILYCLYIHSDKTSPCVIMKKRANQGKKDTLILSHDIFNYPRDTLSTDGINLRAHIKEQIDDLYPGYGSYDYMFCTDADSIITSNSFLDMLETIEIRKADACCGLVVVDFIQSNWSPWNLFQNFQYSYGQHIRRGCENLIGSVTCMPGCITMFKISPTASNALRLYSTLPPRDALILNCVQMLGTDRRLASSFLYQSPEITQVLDYRAKCYTIPPDNFSAYITQRRRWGSNFYFNTICNLFAVNINPFVRMLCIFDIIRFSLDFFRVFSTCLFVYAIADAIVTKNNGIFGVLVPTLSILLFPTGSFFTYALFNGFLRKMYHKLILGYLINKLFSAYISMIIITRVFWEMGSTKWGGVQSNEAPPPPSIIPPPPIIPPAASVSIKISNPKMTVTPEIADADVGDIF